MVMTDGQIEDGEWKGSVVIELSQKDSAFAYVTHTDDHIFIAVKAPFRMIPYIDLFIDYKEGFIHNIHSSSQIGERILTDTTFTDASPQFHFGNSKDWYANEQRFDRIKAQQLLQEDPKRDKNLMQLHTNYPYDGFEYVFKKSRFRQPLWRIRIEVKTGMPGFENIYFPKGSSKHVSEKWQLIRFE
jgi:hypothetical protein